MKISSQTIEIGGKVLTLEIGRFAQQANGAVLARLGDTLVLSTVVSAQSQSGLDYFPLNVEYVERFYAGGRIKGSRWVKREGRPSDEAVLTARLIDRSIRPLFPEAYKNEVQVIITVLSVDGENNPDIPAIFATSTALAISDIPWKGPIGVLRVGYVSQNGAEGTFVINPTYQDLEYSQMDLVVAAQKENLLMIEGKLKEIPEEIILKAIEFIQPEFEKIIKFIEKLQKEIGLKKQVFIQEELPSEKIKALEKEISKNFKEAVANKSFAEIKEALFEKYPEKNRSLISKTIDSLIKKLIRRQILEKKVRVDGRKPQEIRPLEVEVGILPRTHGSAMFKRGETQALVTTTLGSPSLEQLIESMEGEETKRYIHHYYMPPFSLGETGRLGWPSRREIGHGALAEKALEAVIPSEDKFPYTIRVVSEIMSSNGSTSMASVCGSTLSLMDAGVPISAPVSGIAMGKVGETILSDIIGLEDFSGDMDFKVAGTEKGITAIQLDVKALDLTMPILEKALAQAREGRFSILEKMLKALPASRTQLSKFAPKVEVLHIPTEKIGEVIGPGGKTIRQIISETGAEVEVKDDGTINISAIDKDVVERATAWIEGLVREVKPGETFEGEVKRIQPFGAFVEILPGKEGLVHISKMATGYVSDPNQIVKLGQKVKVRVVEIDDKGRINLSMLMREQLKRKPLVRSPRFFPKRKFLR